MLIDVLKSNRLSQSEVARMLGVDKSLISRVCRQEYPDWQSKDQELVDRLKNEFDIPPSSSNKVLHVSTGTIVPTGNVRAFKALANDLLDNPNVTASIGLVKGTAGLGKTAAAKHFCQERPEAVYILYIDGYSYNMMASAIARALTGVKAGSLSRNIELIKEATGMDRRLVIIDEADKMPSKIIELLRAINEECELPILLVGEESLYNKMAEKARRYSRLRKPVVSFDRIGIVDIGSFYDQAIGLSISNPDIAKGLYRRAKGDFRTVVSDAITVCNILNNSDKSQITLQTVEALK